ncbi:Ig domain-containing protein [Larkinella sp. C7]|uniref:Ig domain-containing protein n=1 Tax=Larkinella sp. C7 TaxID=2576607 RepID=UPI00111109B9|nr:Ig domain-containing protein [Larkinella sp. C7]
MNTLLTAWMLRVARGNWGLNFVIVTLAFWLGSLTVSPAQLLDWQKTLGGTDFDNGRAIKPTSDGGYVVAGDTKSNDGDVSGNHGNSDVWVTRLNAFGNVVWQKALGGTGDDFAYAVIPTPDKGFVVAASSLSNNGDVSGNHGESDFWVVKLNSAGGIVWQKALGGTGTEYARAITTTADGGFVVIGETLSNDGDVRGNHGWSDIWVVRLNSTGGLVWQKTIGGSGSEGATAIITTADGDFVITGKTSSNDGDVSGNHGGQSDAWVVKLSGSGNVVWQRALGGSSAQVDMALAITPSPDNGYMIAGTTSSNDGDVLGNHGRYDAWVVQLNDQGKFIWQKTLGGTSDDIANAITTTADGGFLVAGSTNSNDGDVSGFQGGIMDFWVVKLTRLGQLSWQKPLGGTDEESVFGIALASDGGYVVAGYTGSDNGNVTVFHGGHDVWVVKLREPLQVLPPFYSCQTGEITFRTKGGNNTPITFTAPGIMRASAADKAGIVEPGLRSDPKVIPITAIQSGQPVTYNFDLEAACTTLRPPFIPELIQPIPPQVMTQGQTLAGRGLVLSTFIVDPTPYMTRYPTYASEWAFEVNGLPPGLWLTTTTLEYSPLATIQGTPTQAGQFTVTFRASTGQFRNRPILTTFTITVFPAGPLTLQPPRYDCGSGAFHFNTSGGDGSLIEYMAAGITPWTANPDQFVDFALRTANDVQPFTLKARQHGVTVTTQWNLKTACSRARFGSGEPDLSGLQVRLLGNPLSGSLAEVEIRGAEGEGVQLQVINAQGQVLHHKRIQQVGAVEQQRVPIGSSPGQYLLEVATLRERKVLKILKL